MRIIVICLILIIASQTLAQAQPFMDSPSGNGAIYYNGGNVGIGIASPVEKMDINGDMAIGYRLYPRVINTNIAISNRGTGSTIFNNTNSDEWMRITSSGYIGIGTSDPIERLDVNGDMAIGYRLYPRVVDTNIAISNRGTGSTIFNNTNSDEWMRITSSGYVGIGTSDPIERLDINGDMAIGYRIYPRVVDTNIAISNRGTGSTIFNNTNSEEWMRITSSGYVGIGTTTPDSKLTVAGKVHAQEVQVTVNAGADFVFEEDYELTSLEELDQYVKENNHLPEIASAKEMETEGIHLAEMNIKLLQKIEELTLHLIEQNKQLQKQTSKILTQEKRIESLENKILEN